MNKNNPLQINISTNKIVKRKYNSRDFINNHYYPTFKENHFTGIRSFEELVIDHCWCAFKPGCEVLERNNLEKLISPLIKEEKINRTHGN